MDKRTAARIDAGMAYVGGGIVFKEHQITFLQVTGRGDLRPFTDGRESARAVTARTDAAGAQAKIDEARTVESLRRAFFGPGIGFSKHCARNGDQPVRAIGSGIGNVAARRSVAGTARRAGRRRTGRR